MTAARVNLERIWEEARDGHVRLAPDPETGRWRCSCGWVDDTPDPGYPVPGWTMGCWNVHVHDAVDDDLDPLTPDARILRYFWAAFALRWARTGTFGLELIEMIVDHVTDEPQNDWQMTRADATERAARIIAGLPRDPNKIVIR